MSNRQAEQRADRRAKKLTSVHYDSGFSLGEELEAILRPLATAAAELSAPYALPLRPYITATWTAAYRVVAWVAEQLITHPDLGAAVAAFASIDPDQLDDDAITNGTWADDLLSAATPFTKPLAAALAHQTPRPNTSSALVELLEKVDNATNELTYWTNQQVKAENKPSFAQKQAELAAQRQAKKAEQRLAKLRGTR